MHGFRAKTLNKSGRRSIVFNPSQGFRDLPITVPCGQCIGCRLERSRQWAIRLVHEKQLHEASGFLTLTYDPKHLPKHGSLHKKHFQDFMKRYRFWVDHLRLKFFHCGEYGENFGRPHYHAIIFGHDFHDKVPKFKTPRGDIIYTSAKLQELWTHGQVSTANVTFESAAYVARYVTKKITGEKALDHYNVINKETGEILQERSPEYTTMSNGLGKNWFTKYHKDVFPHDEVVLRGLKMKPPKYYSKLYEIAYPEDFQRIKAARIAASKKPETLEHNTFPRLRVREEIANLNLNQNQKRNLK